MPTFKNILLTFCFIALLVITPTVSAQTTSQPLPIIVEQTETVPVNEPATFVLKAGDALTAVGGLQISGSISPANTGSIANIALDSNLPLEVIDSSIEGSTFSLLAVPQDPLTPVSIANMQALLQLQVLGSTDGIYTILIDDDVSFMADDQGNKIPLSVAGMSVAVGSAQLPTSEEVAQVIAEAELAQQQQTLADPVPVADSRGQFNWLLVVVAVVLTTLAGAGIYIAYRVRKQSQTGELPENHLATSKTNMPPHMPQS